MGRDVVRLGGHSDEGIGWLFQTFTGSYGEVRILIGFLSPSSILRPAVISVKLNSNYKATSIPTQATDIQAFQRFRGGRTTPLSHDSIVYTVEDNNLESGDGHGQIEVFCS